MDKIEIATNKDGEEVVVIDRGNGEFTSMLKSTYDEQQAAQQLGGNPIGDNQ